ncbi:MAG: patatin-like phospholipase family protein [Clostridia bacterium]|nr:patatin-like phospholipase family protein [Clostridia bacterium]
MSKTALVLSSGGAKGIAHIGAIQALEEKGIKFDMILGTSIGSLVGGAYAYGLSVQEMKEIAFSLKKNSIMDFSLFFTKNKGLIKGKKIDKLLHKIFGDAKIEDCKIPFACVSNELVSGESVTFNSGYLKRAIRASISIPSLISPLIEDGKIYVDGGVTNRLALRQAKEMGADKIIAVDVLSEIDTSAKIKGPISVMFRSLDCIDHQVAKAKLEIYKPDLLICPNTTKVDPTNFKKAKEIYEIGYNYTKEFLNGIEKI